MPSAQPEATSGASRQQQQATVRRWLSSGSLNLFGPPNAGKDTQCRRLAGWLHAPVISGGDILRQLEQHHNLPPEVRQILVDGLLAPTEYYLATVTPYLARPEFAGRPLVLSSVGRYQGEEAHIVAASREAGHPIRAALLLQLDEAGVRRRWAAAQRLQDRGYRLEDGAEALHVRLREFATKTQPVLDTYRQAGLLVTVDGDQEPDQVEAAILAALYQRSRLPAPPSQPA